MFLELFWPKEIKELVAKYRAEGTLNEESVEYLKHNTSKYLWILAALSLFFILTSESIAVCTVLNVYGLKH